MNKNHEIQSVNVFKNKAGETMILAQIEGIDKEFVHPRPISQEIWQNLWVVPDQKEYKTLIAEVIYADFVYGNKLRLESDKWLKKFNAIQNDFSTPWFTPNTSVSNRCDKLKQAIDYLIANNSWICPIKFGCTDDAYYSISKEEIVVPEDKFYRDKEDYYGEILHNMAHSTGAEKHFDRIKRSSFGNTEYGIEELTAEIAAARVAIEYGMAKTCKADALRCLRSWIELVEESTDNEFINDVLADARQAEELMTSIIEGAIKELEKRPVSNTIIKQFNDLKKKHPDALLLFRCGDYYQTYMEDAEEAAKSWASL